jgi:geranylgeranyl pyrophosphate synthase
MNEEKRKRLGEAFTASLPLPPNTERYLRDAIEDALRNPGSLVRPEIVRQMFSAYELPEACAIDLGVALEYFHTASLLFDDLPCMDDATERRGAPCIHVQYGESGAILTALAFINRAYGLTWKAITAAREDRREMALTYVEQHLGVGGLLNGQSMDLNFSSLPHDCETTEQVAMGKTVSLIRLALVLPAIIGDAPEVEIQLLERVAVYWGLSYQIVDDLKDLLQSSEQSGKTVSRDLSLGRPNIALAIGIEAAIDRLTRFIQLGDRTLHRLIEKRPGVLFLAELKSELNREATRISQQSCEPSVRGNA